MIYRLFTMVFMLLFILEVNAQKDYKWEREHPGIREKPKGNVVPGFATNRLFDVFNQIPIINQPKGYDVRQSASIRLSGNLYKGSLLIGFPLYYRWGTGPLQKQVEYHMTHIYINDRDELRDQYSHFMSEETDKLHMPAIYTDTFPVAYKEINGYMVGMARSRVNQNLYILNPTGRPCFIPVTKEQFVKLWIGKLGLDIAKEKEVLENIKASYAGVKDNPEAVAGLDEGTKMSNLLIAFYQEKKKVYEQKLASLSSEEKKAPAYAATPRNPMVLQHKGKLVEKPTGDLYDELADGIDAIKTTPLYIFNPNFFNPKLPKTAFQLIVIKDDHRQGWKDSELVPLLQKEFFPLIDFKQLGALMSK